MRDILNCMTLFASIPQNALQQQQHQQLSSLMRDTCETQTEIVAVHTPQIENPQQFPFVANKQQIQRPSTLPITSSSNDSSASAKSSQNNTAATNTNTDDFDQRLMGNQEPDCSGTTVQAPVSLETDEK